ncbi:hypothetical protein CU098_002169, partial [Rhizopus stolonifer]
IKKENNSLTKMIECAQEKGASARVARSMGINVRNAQRWWKHEMKGRPSTFTDEHDSYLIELIDDDSQIIVSDIMERLTEKFEGFSISNSQLNHNLKNDLCLTMKKVTFEAEARNSKENLQQRFDWFMQWKDSDIDFTGNCVFIDEAGFHINMLLEPVLVSPSHTIIGAIHSGSVLFVQLRKPPSKKEPLGQQTSKKRKTTNKG